MPKLRTGPWLLSDLASVERNGLTVFSCFCCGGGSTMGYKLAGFECLGGVEIDPRMAALYRSNHHPKILFEMPVQEFVKAQPNFEVYPDLKNLDVLDGSPPCSSFSMSGSREEGWNQSRKFREGQANQILDDLFFHFIEVAKKLQPKIVVAENVKGLIMGNARGYVKWIFEQFEEAGYEAQLFLLNAARMGVPQRRERVFFIARRRDLSMSPIEISFNEDPISVTSAFDGVADSSPVVRAKAALPFWHLTPFGKSLSRAHPKGSFFNWSKLHPAQPAPTVAATCRIMHWNKPRCVTHSEVARLQTFPDDYDFGKENAGYVCGMSVPPFMMQRVAASIAEWLLSQPAAPVQREGAEECGAAAPASATNPIS